MSGARVAGVKSWDETYMMMARDIAVMRSKDPCTQVGAFIADREHRPLSMGYNGAPRGWDDAVFPWGKTGNDAKNTKYPFVVHAERNAILNAPAGTRSLNGATMYVTRFPCGECAKEIAQAGISRVVYGQAKHDEDESVAVMIFTHAGIICEALE